MKPNLIILLVFWIISLSAAYIIGTKISSPTQATAQSNDLLNNTRPLYRKKNSPSSLNSQTKAGPRTSANKNKNSQQNVVSILLQQDPIARINNLLALIQEISPEDFEQTVADFRATGLTRSRMSEYSMLLHAWAKEDPLSALDYAVENTRTSFARQAILASWATDNPEAAIQWAKSNHTGNGANLLLVGVIKGLVDSNPQKATEIMNSLDSRAAQSAALQSITPYLTRLSPEKAIAWIGTIENDKLKISAVGRVAEQLARKDPRATAAWASSLGSEDSRNNAIGEVADTWADQDVASAVAWTETLSGKDKTRAARELISEYANENPEQADTWLNTFSGTDGYDEVATRFIWSTANQSPELSLAKIATLQDTSTHNRYYERILNRWHNRDANAAAAWMQTNNISEEMRLRATRNR